MNTTTQPRTIVFATNNPHKLREIREIMGDGWCVLSLAEIGCNEDIPETALTLSGNAEIKARYVKEHYGYDCFADDTGLHVDALDGAPGVYSARYAGPAHDSEANMALLLSNLEGMSNRAAHFSTVICLILGQQTKFFEGRVDGVITTGRSGASGFGYDPVFMPDGADCTFAEMSDARKNSMSHRGRAVAKLIDYISKL
ncbi:MAG: non-canonical purine NTP diphosphatase [Firmicutes bacterium]|nr:non-canonical purine NTP diphosphatase [Bacillota bacterium]MCM1477461.1 non-canonical purine NTP diphosphatase [Bacteroides sp.]